MALRTVRQAGPFRTVGVDLASQDAHTAMAEIAWAGSAAELVDVRLGVTNDDIAAAATDAAIIGVDSMVAEVYPAAALRIWALPTAGYKTDDGRRSGLVDVLVRRAGWLRWGDWPPVCARSHDALDAVVCAVVAGAVLLGETTGPAPTEQALADEEGWIHLPDKGFLGNSDSDR